MADPVNVADLVPQKDYSEPEPVAGAAPAAAAPADGQQAAAQPTDAAAPAAPDPHQHAEDVGERFKSFLKSLIPGGSTQPSDGREQPPEAIPAAAGQPAPAPADASGNIHVPQDQNTSIYSRMDQETERMRTQEKIPTEGIAGIPANFIRGIKKFEGFAQKAAWDFKQFTNGYGTKASAPGETIDLQTANDRLRDEMTKATHFVDTINPHLDPGSRAALASLTFNSGQKWAQDPLGKAVRDGNLDQAKNYLLHYVNAGGKPNPALIDRRKQEASWFGQQDISPVKVPEPTVDLPTNVPAGGRQGPIAPPHRAPQQFVRTAPSSGPGKNPFAAPDRAGGI